MAPLDIRFADAFKVRYPDAYERLLMDVVRGNATLFMRRDEVEAAWRWVEPILEAWGAQRGGAQALSRRQLGTDRRDRADRARRPDLARGSPLTFRHRRRAMPLHPVIADVTERIRQRSADSRGGYLERLDAMAARGPRRTALSCGNLAHAFAACGPHDKEQLKGPRRAQYRHRHRLQRHALGAPAL